MPFQVPNVKSLSDAGLSFKKEKFGLPKGLASLRSPTLPEAQDNQPEASKSTEKGEPADEATANAQLETSEGPGVMSRSQLQLEQFAKRMAMPKRTTTMNLWKGFGRKDSSEVAEEEDSEDDAEADATQEWAQFSVSEVAQYVPALNYQLPKLPKFSLPSLSLPVRSPSTEGFEDVYLVLRPINFKHSSREILQRIGQVTDMAELQRYLLFQHWGVKVGNHYYHLHIVEEERDDGSKTVRQKLAVSLSDFDQHTLKVPIWQTGKTHEERVMNAISVIRAMGRFKNDDEVDLYGDYSGLQEHILPDEERQRYRRQGPKRRGFLFVPFSGEYNAAVNNCINFSANYLFYHVFDLNPFVTTAADFKRKMTWLTQKWITSGCKLDKEKLMDMFTSPLGLLNPMRTLTKTGDGNIFLVRLLLVFMGKIQPEGSAPVEGISPDINVISEGDVKAAAPQVEKDADAEIEKLKA